MSKLFKKNDRLAARNLYDAVVGKQYDIVTDLINQGVSLEWRYDFNRTVLIIATRMGDYKMVDILLDAGANPYAKSCGWTALDEAIRNNNMDIIEIIDYSMSRNGWFKKFKFWFYS